MAVNFQDVTSLARELTDEEKALLVVWLLEQIKTYEFNAQERLAVFDSMTLDLGDVLPDYSDRRERWYDDAR